MNTSGDGGSWPDAEILARLANELFSSRPGDHSLTPTPSAAAGQADGAIDRVRSSGGGPVHVPHAPAVAPPAELRSDVPLGSTTVGGVPVPVEPMLERFLASAALDIGSSPGVVTQSLAGSSFYFAETAHVDTGPLDIGQVRRDFPILQTRVNGRQLVWLDNAATTQKPKVVIDRLDYFYEHENSNIHRAAHNLAARATDAYEGARDIVRRFLNASSSREIVFVRGATEGINLVAQSWGRQHIASGDEIVLSELEHHANIVPWQRLADEKGARLKVIPVDDDGQVVLAAYGALLGPKTRLVAFTQVSNALGTITPAKQMIEMAHAVGARVLLDGAQAVSHMRVDVQALNSDWYVFSGHKVFAPTGIGVVYGKEALLDEMPPWQSGGNMIEDVTFERTRYQSAPARFEAGTGNIADAVGLGAALEYVERIGIERIEHYEHELLRYATRLLREVPGLRLIGTAPDKAGVLSFVLQGHKTEDVGAALNREGIAVRSGHHCAQPILRRFGLESTVRPSLAFYNTCADIDALVAALTRLSSGRRPEQFTGSPFIG